MKVRNYLSIDTLFSGSSDLTGADPLRFALFASRVVDTNGFWFVTTMLDRPMATLSKEEYITVEGFKLLTASLLDTFKTDHDFVESILSQQPRSTFELFAFLTALVDTQLERKEYVDFTVSDEISSIIKTIVNPKEPLEQECADHVAKFFSGTIEAFTNSVGGQSNDLVH